ncbi:MAG: DsbA family protein [Actinomycetales bacterium]
MPEQKPTDAILQVEVWSDVVCPWCYIGKRNLQRAMEQQVGPVRIVHRAFQLDPGARSEGRRTVDVLVEKYRVDRQQAEQMMNRVSDVAANVGLTYHLEQTTSGNTLDAHRLLLWAQEQGSGQELLEVLYSAYFTEGASIFATSDLLALVQRAGLDTEAAMLTLAGSAYRQQVHLDQQAAARLGATGVPFFLFDGRIAIAGAQPEAVLAEALLQARQDR